MSSSKKKILRYRGKAKVRRWYELGKKVGWIDLMTKLCRLPDTAISPKDIENMYYEILNDMNSMGLDSARITNTVISEYEKILLQMISKPHDREKRQLFVLGLCSEKLQILLYNESDHICHEHRKVLYKHIKNAIQALQLPNTLEDISLHKYVEENFKDIDHSVAYNCAFDEENKTENTSNEKKKFRIEMVVTIIVAIIGAVGVIVAAIISK